MCGSLLETVEAFVVRPSGDDLKCVLRAMQILEAKVVEAIGEFDHAELWDLDGSKSMADWLCAFTELDRGRSWRTATTARMMRSLPRLGEAWRTGAVSSGQVQVSVNHVRPELRERFAEMEAGAGDAVVGLSINDTRTAIRRWVALADAELSPGDPAPPKPSQVHLSSLLDGTVRLDAELSGVDAGIVTEALRLARRDDAEGESRTGSQRSADALVDICQWYLNTRDTKPVTGRNRPHINVIITAADLASHTGATTATGQVVRPSSVEQLLCDAIIHPAVIDTKGVVLDYGRQFRSAPTVTFNALILRDRHCRWPGCDAPPHWCDAHHIEPWEHGGSTDMNNLALLCRRHHTIAHRPGWHLHYNPADNTTETKNPWGETHTSPPPTRLATTAERAHIREVQRPVPLGRSGRQVDP